MPRLLCLLGLVVAGLVLLLFLADLALSGYLAWSALKELK